MKWYSHLAFALCFIAAIGIYYNKDSFKPPRVVEKKTYYKYEGRPLPRAPIKGRRYKSEKDKGHYIYHEKRKEGKSLYDHVCQLFELVANVIPVIVAIAWVVTTIQSRRKAA